VRLSYLRRRPRLPPDEFSEVSEPTDSNDKSDETDAVAHEQSDNTCDETPRVGNTAKCNQSIESELASLRAVVQHRRDTISTLQTKIRSVLTTLGTAVQDFTTLKL
jgi:hypothetical protein